MAAIKENFSSIKNAYSDPGKTPGITVTNDKFGSPALVAGNKPSKHDPEDFEIKLVHRFQVKFGIFQAVGQYVKTIDRPKISFAEIEVPKYNTKAYFAGRKSYEALNLEIDDVTNQSVMSAVIEQLQKQSDFDSGLHAKHSGNYYFSMSAEELLGDGEIIQAWYYDNCFLQNTDFGQLDYSADEGTLQISLTIRYTGLITYLDTNIDSSVDYNKSGSASLK